MPKALARTWKEAAAAIIEVLSRNRNLSRTEENHEKCISIADVLDNIRTEIPRLFIL
jgi:hypothetical protein